MASKTEKKQTILTSMFKNISNEERDAIIIKKIELLNATVAIDTCL